MPNLSTSFIETLAPNHEAAEKGLALVRKGAFVSLNITEDASLLFGECTGSGKDNYRCSADFENEAQPVLRCSCPSRQQPCKHALGLLFAYVLGPKDFNTSSLPREIQQKREKLTQKKEAVATRKPSAPKKENKAALAKKIEIQIEGLRMASGMVEDFLSHGLASLTPKNLQTVQEQIRAMESKYLPGIIRGFQDFIRIVRTFADDKEALNIMGLERLTRLYYLCTKGIDHLNARKEDPELTPETENGIEELLGHIWTLEQLKVNGRVRERAEIMQVGFYSYDDPVREEFVDLGLWYDLNEGNLHETRTYRPYRAKAHVKEEDSTRAVLTVQNLHIYPGDLNKRIRWDEAQVRVPRPEDFARVMASAQASVSEVLKQARGQLKSLLSSRDPAFLLAFSRLLCTESSGKKKSLRHYALEDAKGERITLVDPIEQAWVPELDILNTLGSAETRDAVMAGRVVLDLRNGKMGFVPISIVSSKGLVPLVY